METLKAALRGVKTLVLKEPVYTQALVVAGIALATAFGLNWNGAQVGAVSAFSAAFLAFLTKQVVTPLSAPSVPAGTPVTVTNPDPAINDKVVVA